MPFGLPIVTHILQSFTGGGPWVDNFLHLFRYAFNSGKSNWLIAILCFMGLSCPTGFLLWIFGNEWGLSIFLPASPSPPRHLPPTTLLRR
uniref:Uncharacterized protein n=1 Tax=Rhizophora mucronata TaxID=61149 RepID=A0A2P2JWD1_RHIMU